MITSTEAKCGENRYSDSVFVETKTLWKAVWQWFKIKTRYHLNKQSYFWDIYPREIKILMRMYTRLLVAALNCSSKKRRGRGRTKYMLSKGSGRKIME